MDAQWAGVMVQAVGTFLAPMLQHALRERKSRQQAAPVRQGTLRRSKRPTRRAPETEPQDERIAA